MKKIIICLGILLSTSICAKVEPLDGGTKYVYMGEEGVHIKFPEYVKLIQEVSDFKVVPEGNRRKNAYKIFMFKPKRIPAKNEIIVTLADMTKIRIVLESGNVTYGNDPTDLSIEYFRPKTLDSKSGGLKQNKKMEAITLLKAIRGGSLIAGYKAKTLKKPIALKSPLKTVGIKLQTMYVGRRLNAFGIMVTNKSESQISITQQGIRVSMPDQGILNRIEKPSLAPGESTEVYVVSNSSGRHTKVLIPLHKEESK